MNISEKDLPQSGAGRDELATFYSWSIDDATKAHKKWLKSEHRSSERGPFFRWLASSKLKELSENYEKSKDNSIILEALYVCSTDDLPIPQWCSMAYIESYRHVCAKAATSWDDVFGRPHPKGTHAKDVRVFRGYAFLVEKFVDDAASSGIPKDEKLYSMIGKELGVGGKTKVQELYRYAKQWRKGLEEYKTEKTEEMLEHYSKLRALFKAK